MAISVKSRMIYGPWMMAEARVSRRAAEAAVRSWPDATDKSGRKRFKVLRDSREVELVARAPERPRSRMRSKRWWVFRCAKRISTFLRAADGFDRNSATNASGSDFNGNMWPSGPTISYFLYFAPALASGTKISQKPLPRTRMAPRD
jgi:hypothetical protein